MLIVVGVVFVQPYDHPAYLPSLYSSEDVIDSGLRDQLHDVVKEVLGEMASE
jgi:hypothetical protein